jgi:hypothetical protein
MPVVNRADSRNLEGVISSEAVLKNIGDSGSSRPPSARKKEPAPCGAGLVYGEILVASCEFE